MMNSSTLLIASSTLFLLILIIVQRKRMKLTGRKVACSLSAGFAIAVVIFGSIAVWAVLRLYSTRFK